MIWYRYIWFLWYILHIIIIIIIIIHELGLPTEFEKKSSFDQAWRNTGRAAGCESARRKTQPGNADFYSSSLVYLLVTAKEERWKKWIWPIGPHFQCWLLRVLLGTLGTCEATLCCRFSCQVLSQPLRGFLGWPVTWLQTVQRCYLQLVPLQVQEVSTSLRSAKSHDLRNLSFSLFCLKMHRMMQTTCSEWFDDFI